MNPFIAVRYIVANTLLGTSGNYASQVMPSEG